ncbi:M35 family metallo-endopeptidase [Sandaracinobacteroides saxicola]|uniref:Lysine-specific metallo-endopeptidase domain-containing protein n=1 Tax=Sandaracinobacteroides saxicola TaxID=2759707 RepID=A0A7G5IEJ3_9SPHN|nr:M35 family metallo-endopeptidase [Sandaracinobacteroides saxicola]QMW21785.1 hypothetical protein H3309_10280 [Sandaracinobacteroides saxicola]
MPYTMADLYSTRHAELVKTMTSNDFSKDGDWKTIIPEAKAAIVTAGFNADKAEVCESIRKAVKKGEKANAKAVKTIVTGAGGTMPDNSTGTLPDALAKRVAALDTLRHLWMLKKSGSHKLWVLSLPMSYANWPDVDLTGKTYADATTRLNDSSERFGAGDRKHLSQATQEGLKWIHKAMIVAADPKTEKHKKILKRWFADPDTTDEQLAAAAATINEGLKKMSATIKSSFLLMTDMPKDRSDAGSANTNAFVFKDEAVSVIYIERAFFGTSDTWKDLKNWTRIVVHELTHRDAKTEDHRYRHHGDGLKPNKTTFTHAKAITNADSWAIFCMDCAGKMTSSDYKKVKVD